MRAPPDNGRMPTSRFSDALGHAPADKRLDILRAVLLTGSISQAARDTGVSYKAAWQALDTLTNLAGVSLVERVVGGAGGGGAKVTVAGVDLLALADALNAARSQVLMSRTASVGVWNGVALGLRTSMRNQWRCEVLRVERVGAAARIHLQLDTDGGGVTLIARVTQESAELLALRAGQMVLALCKATAVKITAGTPASDAAQTPGRAARNRFQGTATHITRGETNDEVALQLASALQVVGFAPTGVVPCVGDRAVALLAENAVVVALAD